MFTKYGLLGRNLSHSYSPEIHRELGNKAYKLYEKEPEELESFLKGKKSGGFNVTIPYKRSVLEYADELSDEVKEIGAANTLVIKNGKIHAYNTDMDGFLYMVKRSGKDFKGRKVLVLGSGGASLAVKAGLEKLEPETVVTVSRKGEDNYRNIEKHFDADYIINTTPVGMYPDCPASPLSLKGFDSLKGVYDLIYNPFRTELVMEAEELGIPSFSGLPMLVAQAARSHELFTGKNVETAEIERIIEIILKKYMNIILIGMPGAGKTTVAETLGKLTKRPVIDTDALIEKSSGKTIPEIFKTEGENGFRQRETAEIKECGRKSGIIISVGGGAVTREENYMPLHQNGKIYCLERDIEKLATDDRPLSKDIKSLEQLFRKRRACYDRFTDEKINNNGLEIQTAEAVLNDWEGDKKSLDRFR